MNKIGTGQIQTARLLLRPYTEMDADAIYYGWASDPLVTRFLTWPTHKNADVTKAVLSDWLSRYENGDYFNWAIARKDTGEVIGNIAVVNLEEAAQAAEVGYCLGRAYWGQGVMTEALRAVIDYLFDEAGLNRVAAYHDVNNPASGRVMEKAGMRREGVFRQAKKNNRGLCDVAWYAILKSDRG
ncbi:MAG: GNAT family N-acetyltransferase [Clostridia bacterium]|nr:GNAT family N-acetyltransferase [Clostridia bacterium]